MPMLAAPAASTVALAVASGGSSVTTVVSGTVVTLTATVASSGTSVSPGQVMFCDATATYCQNASLGLAQLVGATGKATLTFTPGPGAHSYKAVFLGTKTYALSTSPAQTLTVTASTATGTGLVTSGSAGNYTLTAQISGNGPYANLSGTASFLDTTTTATLGTATVLPGFVPKYSLGAPVSIGVGNESPSMTTGDFNGDGKMDVAVANSTFLSNNPTDFRITVLLGNGDGTFHAAASPTVSGNSIIAGDFNNDGKTDLVVSSGTSSLTLLLGNGDGTFTVQSSSIPVAGSPFVIAMGDFNQDGNADLAVTCFGSTASTVSILLGNGSGGFTASSLPLPGGGNVEGIAVADFDGDGFQDVAADSQLNMSPFTQYVTVFRGKGDGTFQAGTTVLNGTSYTGSLLAADFNGDGRADLAVSSYVPAGGYGVSVLLSHTDGTFAAPAQTIPDSHSTDSQHPFAAADINNDGKMDLAIGDYGFLTWLVSAGDGSFTTVATATGATSGPDDYLVVTADLNGDGVPDIVTVNSDLKIATSYLTAEAHGAGATLSSVAVGGSGSHTVTVAYSGDSAYTASTSTAASLIATAIPTTLTVAATPTSAASGAQVTLKATLSPASLGTLKSDGDTVTFISGTTTLGTGTLASGVASVTTTALPVGTDSVTASFAGDANFAASSASAVQVAITPLLPAVTLSATSLTFAQQVSGIASAAQSITVTNSGLAPLTVSSVTANGDFAQTNTCTTVAVGATCTIAVTFTPTASGSRTGTLILTDNAATSPQTVALTGTGAPVILTATTPSLTIASPGGTASTPLQVAAATGFSGSVSLTCAVTYSGSGTASLPPTCALSPAQGNVATGTNLSSTLTISTTAASSALHEPALPFRGATGTIGFAGLLLLGWLAPRRRGRNGLLVLLLGVGLMSCLAGCGGSSSSSGPSSPGTSVGNYQITVTAAANSVNTTSTVALTLQ